MNTLSYKTKSASRATLNKEWVIIDAKDSILGRLASEAAKLLRGKNKTNYTPHMDCGDHVIIINSQHIKLSGNKWVDREHFRHTGHPGGQRRETPEAIHEKNPIKLVEQSVKGMLPKTKLGRAIYKNLYVYPGHEHNHEAQQPREFKI